MIPIADPVRELKKINNYKKLFTDELMKGKFVGGKHVENLQSMLSEKLGSKYVITTNSGTDALILSISELNLKKGDEVLVPSFTFFATIEALLHFRLKPVFIDIDKDNFKVNTKSFFENVNKKTKAFLPVHLFGKVFFNSEILEFCKNNNIKIVEDVAQAFGTKYENKYLGTFGELGAFSLFPSKTLGGIGDGGFITTNSKTHFNNLLKIKNHGQSKPYQHEINGVNSRLDALNAFTLIKKLEIFNLIEKSRQDLLSYFNSNISNKHILLPKFNKHELPNYYCLIVNSKRQNLIDYLSKNEIATNVYYPKPVHLQPALKHLSYKYKNLKNSEFLSKKIVAIPFFSFMKRIEKEKIVETLNNYNSK